MSEFGGSTYSRESGVLVSEVYNDYYSRDLVLRMNSQTQTMLSTIECITSAPRIRGDCSQRIHYETASIKEEEGNDVNTLLCCIL